MSQPKLHTIRIKKKDINQAVLTGANTEIYIDDVLVRGCTFFKLEIKPTKVAKVTLELLVSEIEIDEATELHVDK